MGGLGEAELADPMREGKHFSLFQETPLRATRGQHHICHLAQGPVCTGTQMVVESISELIN